MWWIHNTSLGAEACSWPADAVNAGDPFVQVVAPGKGWEVVRFALAHSGSSPPQCAGLYDWDLAKAAEAAAVKATKPRKAERQVPC